METNRTKEEIIQFVEELGLPNDASNPLLNQLRNGRNVVSVWKNRSKVDWEKYHGITGVDIYNYLHTIEEDQNNEYIRYTEIATTLKHDESVQVICDRLMKITCSKLEHQVPFIFLEGSSGTGKSQMAFNIMSRLEGQRLCFYLLFKTPGSNAQKIYQNFWNISSLFDKCVKQDQIHYEGSESLASRDLFVKSLYIYGFISKLLSGSEGGDVCISPVSGKEVLEQMENLGLPQKRPIFLIDECILPIWESMSELRFVRNCFRSLGLGLVMLGTDSRAAQLPSNIGDSSRTDGTIPWCYIFGSYPPTNLDIIKLPDNSPSWYQEILKNSRPLFACILTNALKNGVEDFDALLKTAFEKVVDVKKIFRNYYGQLGQIRLFQNAHAKIQDFGDQPTALIHSHFAQLSGEKNLVLNNDGCLAGQDEMWNPCSEFPLVSNDVLLYLILMSGKGYPAFQINSRPCPYAHFFLNTVFNVDHRRHMLDLSNRMQRSNDGNFLESLLCTTVCLSSHCNGIGGVSLKEFLLNLIFQLQNALLNREDVVINNLEMLASKQNMKIPFLSPPNMRWPEYLLEIPNSNFGNLERAKNADKAELLVNISAEAKDYGKTLRLETLREILQRIPVNTQLHLVFTRKLQDTYFNRRAKAFRDEFGNSHTLNMAYFKIDASQPNTCLERIGGLPDTVTGGNGIVIFVIIDESIKL